eukprot:6579793-Prymnesium_polylepis.1
MEVEAQVAHFLRFSPAVLCRQPEARCALELGHPAGGRPLSCYRTPDTQCAHPSFSASRPAFLRDCPARRPRRRARPQVE